MGKPKGGKGTKGGKGRAGVKGKFATQNVYTPEERSQAYLVNAERVAAGLPPASIASICRSRRRSAARHDELHRSELARREEPTVPRPPPPEPPAPRRRLPPTAAGDGQEGGDAPLEMPPEDPETTDDGQRWKRSVKLRAAKISEPTTPEPVVLRSVSRSASPSEGLGIRLRSRSPTLHSQDNDLDRAVRGEAAPSRPAPKMVPGSPDQESSSDDLSTRVIRGGDSPSHPKATLPDFGHGEVDHHLPPVGPTSDEDEEGPGRGENTPSKEKEEGPGKPPPAALIRLLEGYPQMGEDYAPYTAVLGWQRRNPKLIWHWIVAVRQELPRVPETHAALQQRGQQFERRVFQLIGYGTNRAAYSRADGTAVLKLGMPGSHGLECLIAPRVGALAARIYDAGAIHLKILGHKVQMDIIIQEKFTLLRDWIKAHGAVPEEYWSYTVAVISAVASRGLNLADLGQSNLACVASSDSAPWPKLRFIDMGSWLEDQPGQPPAWPSRDSQLWSFMSGHIAADKVATLKSISHNLRSPEEIHCAVRSILSPPFQEALREDAAWL